MTSISQSLYPPWPRSPPSPSPSLSRLGTRAPWPRRKRRYRSSWMRRRQLGSSMPSLSSGRYVHESFSLSCPRDLNWHSKICLIFQIVFHELRTCPVKNPSSLNVSRSERRPSPPVMGPGRYNLLRVEQTEQVQDREKLPRPTQSETFIQDDYK